jgi:hypothetical protein
MIKTVTITIKTADNPHDPYDLEAFKNRHLAWVARLKEKKENNHE